jgi:hypothetical protein
MILLDRLGLTGTRFAIVRYCIAGTGNPARGRGKWLTRKTTSGLPTSAKAAGARAPARAKAARVVKRAAATSRTIRNVQRKPAAKAESPSEPVSVGGRHGSAAQACCASASSGAAGDIVVKNNGRGAERFAWNGTLQPVLDHTSGRAPSFEERSTKLDAIGSRALGGSAVMPYAVTKCRLRTFRFLPSSRQMMLVVGDRAADRNCRNQLDRDRSAYPPPAPIAIPSANHPIIITTVQPRHCARITWSA